MTCRFSHKGREKNSVFKVALFNLHKLTCILCQKKGERNDVADGAAYGPALPFSGSLPCSGVRWKASSVALCLPRKCVTVMLLTTAQTLGLRCAGGVPSLGGLTCASFQLHYTIHVGNSRPAMVGIFRPHYQSGLVHFPACHLKHHSAPLCAREAMISSSPVNRTF